MVSRQWVANRRRKRRYLEASLQPPHGSLAELHRTRKTLPPAEEVAHPDSRLSIIFLQREIYRLLAALIVDQPKSALATIPDLVVVHLPIKDERASPFQPDSHPPAG